MFGNNIGDPFMSYDPMMRSLPIMNTGNAAMMGMRGPGMIGMNNTSMIAGTPRTGGLLSSLFGRGTGGLTGARTFNFGNILNNASKALGVVKEAIPIVKEVGPMMGNMKSILKIASVFKDETDTNTNTRKNTTTNTRDNITIENTNKIENDTRITSTTTNDINNNEPNFFL